MTVKTKLWLKAAGIRAVKTIAQTAVATIGTSAVLGDVNWIAVASASVLAGILSAHQRCRPAGDPANRGLSFTPCQQSVKHCNLRVHFLFLVLYI